jgi:hypothetical protein
MAHPPDDAALRAVDGGASAEDMALLWEREGSWPLTLSVRAFNQYDFETFPGGVANHRVEDRDDLVHTLIELGSARPDAPFPLLFRLQVVRVGERAPDVVFLSETCGVESLSELRAAYARVTRSAADRFSRRPAAG